MRAPGWTRDRPTAVLLAALALLGGCGDPDAAPGATAEGASDALAVGALPGGAGYTSRVDAPAPPPLAVPAADWTAVAAEVEPNDADSLAQRLGPSLSARGRLDGHEVDQYVWTVDGEPQYWFLEAVVPDRESAEYVTPDGRQEIPLVKMREEPDGASVLALAGLRLLPGEHRIRLRGAHEEARAEYRVRVVPLGPADPRLEREPNDAPEQAHVLTAGLSRYGYLPGPNDADRYRYRVRQPERLRVELAGPPDQRVEMVLSIPRGDRLHLTPADDETDIVYEGLIPVGELAVELRADGVGGTHPYGIRIVRLDPFERPADLEPNDHAGDARPLPATMVAEGDASGRDRDWYVLPPRRPGTRVTLAHSLDDAGDAPSGLAIYTEVPSGQVRAVPWERDDTTLTLVLPDSAPAFLSVAVGAPYRIEVGFDPAPDEIPAPPTPPGATLALGAPALIAAYWERAQRLQLPVRVENAGEVEETVELELHLSDPRWRGRLEPRRITVAPGRSGEVVAEVLIPPFAASGSEPVDVTVAAFGPGRGHVVGTSQVVGVCGAPAVGEEEWWPLPASMLGGLDVASTTLGAGPIDPEGGAWRGGEERLHDPTAPARAGWAADHAKLPVEHSVRLAGGEPIEVAGVVLTPVASGHGVPPRRFEILVSTDGLAWERVLEATLLDLPEPQPFALESPVTAAFARLRILDAHRLQPGQSGQVELHRFGVIARPGSHAMERQGIDLARPDLGGHVVRAQPHVAHATRSILGGDRTALFRPDPAEPASFVVGFHHGRAAQVQRIVWVQAEDGRAAPYAGVRIAASTDGPLGPWTPIHEGALDTAPGSTTTMAFDTLPWARFLRFSPIEDAEEPNADSGDIRYRAFPTRLRVVERVPDGDYRSILGEWGRGAATAVYEKTVARRTIAYPRDDNTDRERARRLDPGAPVAGIARVGEREAWYRVEVPAGDNRLELVVEQDPTVGVEVAATTDTGEPVALERAGQPGRSARYGAAVEGGRSYFVRVAEPPRHITIVWDQSGSVGPFRASLDRALARFVGQVQPGVERLNLLPFWDEPDERFVLPEWTDQPLLLQAGLAWNGEGDGSSEAERNLLAASSGMGGFPGTRAVLLMTDAESGDDAVVPALWRSLDEHRPRVFAVELQSGKPELQDVMQDWAAAAGGRYDSFSTDDGLDAAFERTSCLLRRPALFTLTATTAFHVPPGPARIRVRVDSAAPRPAIELILDASGSMLQRLEGTRRIDIAREVLERLVTEELPRGVPLALRIFGHREAGSCRTDLEVPLAPLDPTGVARRIRGVQAMNLAKTPIAASLEKVREDLEGATGGAFVVLITDGEETCDGDPAAAIDSLKAWGVNPRVSVIGFAIDDDALKAEFQRWARAGGGHYFDARGARELGEALRGALRPKYQVLDESGDVVAEGTAGDAGVEVAPGRYSVRLLISPVAVSRTLEVAGDQQVELTLPEPRH